MHSSFMPILVGTADECNRISEKEPNGNKMDILIPDIIEKWNFV